MSLEKAVRVLAIEMEKLRDALDGFRLVVEDKPKRGEVALVDRFGYAASDMLDWMGEAQEPLRMARQSVSQAPVDCHLLHRALSECQERFGRIHRMLSCDLEAGEIEELMEFGKNRRGSGSDGQRECVIL